MRFRSTLPWVLTGALLAFVAYLLWWRSCPEPSPCPPRVSPPANYGDVFGPAKSFVMSLPPLPDTLVFADSSNQYTWPSEGQVRMYMLSDTSGLHGPDFSDDGVSKLFTGGASSSPTYVDCYAASIYGYISSPSTTSLYLPYTDVTCDWAGWNAWWTTSSQKSAWEATGSSVKTSFMQALRGYRTWLEAGNAGPFYIDGLGYGSTNTNSYIRVLVDKEDGSAGYYRVILIRITGWPPGTGS